MYTLYSGDKLIKFSADKCLVKQPKDNQEPRVELSEKVQLFEYKLEEKPTGLQQTLFRTFQCNKAIVHVEGEGAFALTIEMFNPALRNDVGSEGLVGREIVGPLLLPVAVEATLSQLLTGKTLDVRKCAQMNMKKIMRPIGPSNALALSKLDLDRKLQRTVAEIHAEKHSRLVFGLGCIPMILIGIGLGVILKDGHLLAAFAASAVPAAVLIVFMMMGANITKNLSSHAAAGGRILMWTGPVLLVFLTVFIYRKLLRT